MVGMLIWYIGAAACGNRPSRSGSSLRAMGAGLEYCCLPGGFPAPLPFYRALGLLLIHLHIHMSDRKPRIYQRPDSHEGRRTHAQGARHAK